MKCLFNVFFLYHIVTGKINKSNQTLINSVILKHYNLTEPHYPLPFLSVWECAEILNYAHWGAFVHAFFITKGDNTKIFLSKHAKMFWHEFLYLFFIPNSKWYILAYMWSCKIKKKWSRAIMKIVCEWKDKMF